MARRTNIVLYLFVLIIVVVLTSGAVSAQDTIEITNTANASSVPTAIIMQSLEVERSPLEWVMVLQGAIFLFLLTLLMINEQVRSHVLERVRVRRYNQYDI